MSGIRDDLLKTMSGKAYTGWLTYLSSAEMKDCLGFLISLWKSKDVGIEAHVGVLYAQRRLLT